MAIEGDAEPIRSQAPSAFDAPGRQLHGAAATAIGLIIVAAAGATSTAARERRAPGPETGTVV